jgi:hypothetical protein
MGDLSQLKVCASREERQPRLRADTEPEALSSIPEQEPGRLGPGA